MLMKFNWVHDVKIEGDSAVSQQGFFNQWKNNYEENLKNGYFNSSKRISHIGIFELQKYVMNNIPLVISTVGPSLSKQLPLLKEYGNKFFHMTLDVTLPILVKQEIPVHCVVTIDPSSRIHEIIKSSLINTENMILITPTCTYPGNLLDWKGPIIFYQQKDLLKSQWEFLTQLNNTKYTSHYGELMNAGTVSSAAIQAAIKMKFKHIALVGHDLAYTDAKTYCDEAFGYMNNIPNMPKEDPYYQRIYNEMIEFYTNNGDIVPDIYGKPIRSSGLFMTYANYYYMLMHNYTQFYKDLLLCNCTEGGILYNKDFMNLVNFKDWLFNFGQKQINSVELIRYTLRFK